MTTYERILNENTELVHLKDALNETGGIYDLTGVSDAAKPLIIDYFSEDTAGPVIVISDDEDRARELCKACRSLDGTSSFYPAKDILFYESDIHGNTQTRERISVLKKLREQRIKKLFISIDALTNALIPPEDFYDGIIKIKTEDSIDQRKLKAQLVNMGYESVHTTEHKGTFSVRGGIIDVFPLVAEHPLRIELWGDEIDSIRSFDEITQKSIEKINEAEIYPAMELILEDVRMFEGMDRLEKEVDQLYEDYRNEMKTEEAFRLRSRFEEKKESITSGVAIQEAEALLPYFCDRRSGLLDYIEAAGDMRVVFDDAAAICERAAASENEFTISFRRRLESGLIFPGQTDLLLSSQDIINRLNGKNGVILTALDAKRSKITSKAAFYIRQSANQIYRGNIPLFIKDLAGAKKRKLRTLVVLKSESRAKRLAGDLADSDINAFYTTNDEHDVHPGEVMIIKGGLERGLSFPETGWQIFSESDIFGAGARRRRRRRTASAGERIRRLEDLKAGDYVVHENHGLGIYRGMEKINVGSIKKDYIKIAYANGASLYILADQFDRIGKYSNAGDSKPKLSSLGTSDWSKTKAKVKGAVADVARDLVELYAERQKHHGHVYGKDTVWQKEFEDTFPYEETEGQLCAISDVKADMESEKIMDRLICGDVGFGKTEVALRAAFKAVQESKQVVYLCPTTILCRQHYNTFVQRMEGYPVNVGILSRFSTPSEMGKTIAGLKSGEVDIVIGTHRVLSKDVEYKDLGLLIIDEEQRFGVRHKERIKQMRRSVDVMSLSATPIPRTLHMSLVGIRDMSLLDEAPMERMPIQTFVFEQNDEMIREAINRELSRGGQVYYVSNRVKGIDELAYHIGELVPEASVAYAHGRMEKNRLEDIMTDFINQDIDVLVATTIIEIGLDISNVNTIIIHDADKLGLAQLYQLRGRVGRSNRSAYAFLMYKRDKILREVAEKRLSAIREFTDLGSGFKIAMRDLEIRGAGTMLGAAQSGHMEAVGYDLYCKLLSEAVKEQKGEKVEEDFETTIDLRMDAFIPAGYIEDEGQKLDIYRRIASISNAGERDELIEELIDRYGDIPKALNNLLQISEMRHLAHRAYVTDLKQDEKSFRINLLPSAGLDPLRIPELLDKYTPWLIFVPDKKQPYFDLDLTRNRDVPKRKAIEYMRGFLEDLENIAIS